MRHKQAFGYFRMGLVTGILDKQALVEWADQQILQDPVPEWEVIELSLSGHLPYSQLVRLLTGFQGAADYDLPLKALFARAGIWLEEDPVERSGSSRASGCSTKRNTCRQTSAIH